jgi:hypothetical protein
MYQQTVCATALLSLSLSLAAQTPDNLIGLTRGVPSLRSIDHQNCAVLGACNPVGFPNSLALPANAGGTAWDPTTRGAWITNGTMLAKVDDTCAYQCAAVPFVFPVNAYATGLEVVESRRQLLVLDNLGGLHTYRLGCPPQPVSRCTISSSTIPFDTAGIAVDEGLELVFFALVNPLTGDNVLAVSSLNDPCTILQRLQVPSCPASTTPFRATTGLCVDWCRRILYTTDGRTTMAIRYTPGAIGILLGPSNCCTPPAIAVDTLVGLAVVPGRETAAGNPCANGTCPNCPMRHSLGNDSNVGNLDFHLDLVGAPAGSLAWAIIGDGRCTNTGPSVHPLCGPIYAGRPFLGALGPVPTGPAGGSVCGGDARFRLSLPVIPSLCGSIVSSQCVVLCSSLTGLIGTSMSNCVSFELQGS